MPYNYTSQPQSEKSRAKHCRSEQVGFEPVFIHARLERWNADLNTQWGLLVEPGTATFGAPHSPSWAAALVLSMG